MSDLSSYEVAKLAYNESRRPNNSTMWALGLGVFGAVAAAGAWIFSGVYASQSSKAAQRDIDRLATSALSERNERVANQNIVNKTVLDIASGAYANAYSTSTAQALALQTVGGSYNGLPTGGTIPVSLWQAPQACCCPNPCGCNG